MRIKLASQCALALQYLCEHAGKVVTPAELLDAVWGRNAVSIQSVPVVISKLRALLGDDLKNPRYIETISKRGYRLIAAVENPLSEPPVTKPFGWIGASRPILITMTALLLALGLVLLYNQLKPSLRDQQLLYIADVENLTNEETLDAVAAGAGVILSSELARVGGLSIVRLRGSGDSLKEEATRRLGFGETMPPILRTSVVQTETGSGVVMLLEDGADRRFVWTHAFEVTETTYAAAQREAAHRLLDYLNVEENRQAVTYSSNVPRVEENYLRAKYMWSLRGRDNNALAANLALRVLQLDADYLPAHALLAEIYTKYDGEYLNLGPVDTETLARGHLRAAESIDPNHLSVLVARARQLLLLDRRPDLALAVLEKAVKLAPGESMPYRLRASALIVLGRMDESLRDLEAALELEFGSPYVEVEFILNHYLSGQ
ncbi:MAG: winged helix-turn-helix domain-containing protein, partial [Sphingomonadales bacterium]